MGEWPGVLRELSTMRVVRAPINDQLGDVKEERVERVKAAE